MTTSADPAALEAAVAEPPTVSVVVPTFRRPGPLRRCLEALAASAYRHDRLEVVVVDDGGGLPADLLVGLPPDVTVRLESQPNRGPASARNLGARVASGEVVAFTDDDCRPRPEWIPGLAVMLQAEPTALVGGPVVNALPGNRCAQASQDLVSFLYDYFPRGRALRPFFTSNNVACRRDAFLGIGGFDQTFRFSAGEDRDFAERWAKQVGKLRYLPAAIVDHYHDLTLRRFLRQHHYYGRGAAHLARRRRLRGDGAPRPEPFAFYAEMLSYPVRRHPGWGGVLLAGLIALSQVAGLSGMAAELLNPSYRGD